MDVSGPRVSPAASRRCVAPRAGTKGPHQLDRLAQCHRVERARRRRRQELLEPPLQVGGAVPQRGAAFVGEQIHGHRPAAIDLSQHTIVWDEDAVVEHLAELGHPVHRSIGRTVMPGLSMSTKKAVMPRCAESGVPVRVSRTQRSRVLGQAGPHLLALHPPPVTIAGRPAGERRQVVPCPAPRSPGTRSRRRATAAAPWRPRARRGHSRSWSAPRPRAWSRCPARRSHARSGPRPDRPATDWSRPALHPLGPAHAHEPRVVGQPHDLAQLRHLLVERPDALDSAASSVSCSSSQRRRPT